MNEMYTVWNKKKKKKNKCNESCVTGVFYLGVLVNKYYHWFYSLVPQSRNSFYCTETCTFGAVTHCTPVHCHQWPIKKGCWWPQTLANWSLFCWDLPGDVADTGASPYPTAGAGQAGVGAGPVPLMEGCRPRDPGLAMAVGGTPVERPGPARGAEVCTFTWAMLYSWNHTINNKSK